MIAEPAACNQAWSVLAKMSRIVSRSASLEPTPKSSQLGWPKVPPTLQVRATSRPSLPWALFSLVASMGYRFHRLSEASRLCFQTGPRNSG